MLGGKKSGSFGTESPCEVSSHCSTSSSKHNTHTRWLTHPLKCNEYVPSDERLLVHCVHWPQVSRSTRSLNKLFIHEDSQYPVLIATRFEYFTIQIHWLCEACHLYGWIELNSPVQSLPAASTSSSEPPGWFRRNFVTYMCRKAQVSSFVSACATESCNNTHALRSYCIQFHDLLSAWFVHVAKTIDRREKCLHMCVLARACTCVYTGNIVCIDISARLCASPSSMSSHSCTCAQRSCCTHFAIRTRGEEGLIITS